MKPVQAQFMPRRRPGRFTWVVAALWVAMAGIAATLALRQHAELRLAQQALDAAQRQAARAVLAASVQRPTPPQPYDASAREMLRERALPWPQVLTALESVTLVAVTPTSMELLASEQTVRVEASFGDHARLLEYLAALNAGVPGTGPAWRWALLQTQSPPTGVGISTLQARWGIR